MQTVDICGFFVRIILIIYMLKHSLLMTQLQALQYFRKLDYFESY